MYIKYLLEWREVQAVSRDFLEEAAHLSYEKVMGEQRGKVLGQCGEKMRRVISLAKSLGFVKSEKEEYKKQFSELLSLCYWEG